MLLTQRLRAKDEVTAAYFEMLHFAPLHGTSEWWDYVVTERRAPYLRISEALSTIRALFGDDVAAYVLRAQKQLADDWDAIAGASRDERDEVVVAVLRRTEGLAVEAAEVFDRYLSRDRYTGLPWYERAEHVFRDSTLRRDPPLRQQPPVIPGRR